MKLLHIKTSLKILIRIIKDLWRLIKFGHIKGLGSQTVDRDDLKIADFYLKNPEKIYDQNIIDKYENKFAEYNESKFAYSFMGGRVALSACIDALGVREGDSVMVPAYTCVVVPNAFWYKEIEIIFYDIELETFGPSVYDLKKKWKPKVKAILIHHLFGIVCRDYEALIEFGKINKVPIIEDCAHSTGARYKGVRVGNYGDVAFYSSEQSKVFSTFNGGMATTNNEKYAIEIKKYQKQADYPDEERVRKLLNSFKYCYYSQKNLLGFLFKDFLNLRYANSLLQSTTEEEMIFRAPKYYGQKMPAALAAIGLNQIRKIDRYNDKRRERAKQLELLAGKGGYKLPRVISGSEPVFLRYPIIGRIEEKKRVNIISERIKNPVGVWFQSYLHPVEYNIKGCHNANVAVKRCINLGTL